jgi:hypothetical protein
MQFTTQYSIWFDGKVWLSFWSRAFTILEIDDTERNKPKIYKIRDES